MPLVPGRQPRGNHWHPGRYLNGQETPTFRRSETVGQLGFVWDIWLDWGISVMDYRAFVKNPGAALPTL